MALELPEGLTDAELDALFAKLRSDALFLNRLTYIVLLLTVAACTIQLCLCLYGLALYRSSDKDMKKRRKRSVIFSFALLGIFMLYTVLEAWVFPQLSFEATMGSLEQAELLYGAATWDDILILTLGIGIVVFADGFIILRCYSILQNHRFQRAITGGLVCIHLGMTTMAIATPIWVFEVYPHPQRVIVAWVSLSGALNTIATVIIVLRLNGYRRRLTKTLGEYLARKYAGVLAMVVESCLPMTLLGMTAVVMYTLPPEAVGNAASVMILSIHICVAALCPQFIVFRVAIGSSYTDDLGGSGAKEELSQLRFGPPGGVRSEQSDDFSSGAVESVERDPEVAGVSSVGGQGGRS